MRELPKTLYTQTEGKTLAYVAGPEGGIVYLAGRWPGIPAGAVVSGDILKNLFDSGLHAPNKAAYLKALDGEESEYLWSGSAGFQYWMKVLPVVQNNKIAGVIGMGTSLEHELDAAGLVAETGAQSFTQLLLSAREREKKEIAVALHDELGVMAVAMSSLLGILQEDIRDGRKTDALRGIKKFEHSVENFVHSLKNIVVNLRPPNLDTIGLNGAVRELIAKINRYSKVKIEFATSLADDCFPGEHCNIVLYRVVQESVNNALRHSGTELIKIAVSSENGKIKVAISDSGKGFRYKEILDSNKASSVGVLGMKESVESLGGDFMITSRPGRGTIVEASCPAVTYMAGI